MQARQAAGPARLVRLRWTLLGGPDPDVVAGVGVVEVDERLFEIASVDPEHPLTEHKAKGVAEALRRQDMFDEINVQPRDEEIRRHPSDDEIAVEPPEEHS